MSVNVRPPLSALTEGVRRRLIPSRFFWHDLLFWLIRNALFDIAS